MSAEVEYTEMPTARCHYGVAMAMKQGGLSFIIMATTVADLAKIKKVFSDDPLRVEGCKRAIMVKDTLSNESE